MPISRYHEIISKGGFKGFKLNEDKGSNLHSAENQHTWLSEGYADYYTHSKLGWSDHIICCEDSNQLCKSSYCTKFTELNNPFGLILR